MTPDTPNDASVGDLDGDGEYELIIHQVGRGRVNSQGGVTAEPSGARTPFEPAPTARGTDGGTHSTSLPRHRGAESWVAGARLTGLWNAKGGKISDSQPRSVNFAVWWDGDPLRKLLDRNVIYK